MIFWAQMSGAQMTIADDALSIYANRRSAAVLKVATPHDNCRYLCSCLAVMNVGGMERTVLSSTCSSCDRVVTILRRYAKTVRLNFMRKEQFVLRSTNAPFLDRCDGHALAAARPSRNAP